MNRIKTNRDFYLALTKLTKNQTDATRSLEGYLLAILELSNEHQMYELLPIMDFFALLAEAFDAEMAQFDPAWRDNYQSHNWEITGYEGWHSTIIRQIVDLREMDEAGILEDEYRYYGVDSPRGARWYNFTPRSFLECATAGSFGGWHAGDGTGRDFVPEVTEEAKEREQKIIDFEEISWDEFRFFLLMGQQYE